jgi:hypothetical protein
VYRDAATRASAQRGVALIFWKSAVMHRSGIATACAVWLLCTVGALACSSDKSRTDRAIVGQSSPAVDPPATPDSGARARVETFTHDDNRLPDDAWAKADGQTRRLHPSAFPTLPSTVVGELQRLGCTIPQTDGELKPHNVVTGRFLSAANHDWAVLCSRDRVSSILVFPNGAVDDVREVEASPDADWLQGMGGGRIGFSRAIGVADARYIVSHYEEYGGPKPPLLDHDGINHMFVEKGSTVLYWRQGNWLRLQGAD